MKTLNINETIQWLGTAFILAMYVLMNFFKDLDLHPVAGLLGGLCYLVWTIRVANKPQMLVNIVAIAVCAGGLFKAWS